MKKKFIVKYAREFEDIIKNGRCSKNKYFIIHYKPNNLPYDKFGISVSKKLGNAVFRNKYKRIIRSIIDNYKKHYNNGEDYIIILRREAIDKKYDLLENELFALINNTKKGNNN
jgi:ribonuclease P protein component